MNKSPPCKKIPVYTNTYLYAQEHGELPQYRASHEANIDCKYSIEAAIHEYHDGYYFNSQEAVPLVVRQFGYERVFYVLANSVREREWDGRISTGNKAWARTIPVPKDECWNAAFLVDKVNPGLLNLFVNEARHEYLLTKPLKVADIRAEAEKILHSLQSEQEPNSPNRTHFMAQISPDFMRRAKTKDTDRLMDFLPFASLSLSTLEGRTGVFALISKDEDRQQSLRLRKPSVRKTLHESSIPKAPAANKSKTQER